METRTFTRTDTDEGEIRDMRTNRDTGASPQETVVNLITRILDQFTYHPEARIVRATPIGRSWMIKIQLHRADTPRAVGEHGSHIKALETLAMAIGQRHDINVRVQLVEPEVGEPERYHKFKPRENWNSAEVQALGQDLANAIFDYPASVKIHDSEDYNSSLEVEVDGGENRMMIEAVKKALEVIFNAVGKANGRILFVDVAVKNPPKVADAQAIKTLLSDARSELLRKGRGQK